MQRTSRLRTALLNLRRKLPFWCRRWLATNWRHRALTHTNRADEHLARARELRADAQQITELDPEESDNDPDQ